MNNPPSSPGLRFLHQAALNLLPLLLESLPVILQHLLLLSQPLLLLAGLRLYHNNEELNISGLPTCIPEATLQCHSRRLQHSPFRHQNPGSRAPAKNKISCPTSFLGSVAHQLCVLVLIFLVWVESSKLDNAN